LPRVLNSWKKRVWLKWERIDWEWSENDGWWSYVIEASLRLRWLYSQIKPFKSYLTEKSWIIQSFESLTDFSSSAGRAELNLLRLYLDQYL
jgi:hypothetical protein